MFEKIRHYLINRIDVPDSLEAITSIDPEEIAQPEWVGFQDGQVEKIWKAVESLYRSGLYPAVSFCLRRHGEVVLNRAIGHVSGNGPGDQASVPKVPVSTETPFCLFSASKAVTAMLVHWLAEQHQINLLDPVSYYVPAFGANGKEDISIHQVLCHKAGIPMIQGDLQADLIFDDDWVRQLIFNSRPIMPHGHYYAYHAVTGGYVLGEVVQAVTGKSIRNLIDEVVCKPMGMRYFNYGLPQESVPLMALNYATGLPVSFPVSSFIKRALGATFDDVMRVSNDPRFHQVVIPAGNLMATANECARFYQCLLDEGRWEGKTIFHPMTIRRAVAPTGRAEFDRVLLAPIRYSAGMILGGNPVGIYGPQTGRAYGHLGLTNNFTWADPDRGIAVALLTSGNPILGPHLLPLGWLLTQISRQCPKMERREALA
jgi:CubicO group peptidase (beta-lactamase class C family)